VSLYCSGQTIAELSEMFWLRPSASNVTRGLPLMIVRLLRGSHITMEQTRVDDGIWMPERVEVRAAARIFFVKSLVIDRVLTYSEYRLPQAGVPTTRDPVIP